LLIVSAYFSFVFAWGRAANYQKTWAVLGVDQMDKPFADARGIVSGVETARLGGDPLLSNPRDPWQRTCNYPRLWLLVGWTGIDQEHTSLLAVVFEVAFATVLFMVTAGITWAEGVYLGLLICSPPVMLAISRANNDLLIFALLGGAIFLKGIWRYLTLGLCAALKLYPAVAFVLVLSESKRRALLVAATSGGLLAVYLFSIRHDLALIFAGTPRTYFMSYGSTVVFTRFAKLAVFGERLTALGAMVLVGLGACVFVRRQPWPDATDPRAEMLLSGATVYVGTFVLGFNFIYRLIFVLLLVPLLLAWTRLADRRRGFAYALLGTIAAVFFLAPAGSKELFLVRELADWTLFGGGMVILLQGLRSWSLRPERAAALPVSDDA
jgi:hypothetical protein